MAQREESDQDTQLGGTKNDLGRVGWITAERKQAAQIWLETIVTQPPGRMNTSPILRGTPNLGLMVPWIIVQNCLLVQNVAGWIGTNWSLA